MGLHIYQAMKILNASIQSYRPKTFVSLLCPENQTFLIWLQSIIAAEINL